MWRATIKSLFARKVRLALTALAVILGVAFVAGTFVLTDTINHTFDNLFAEVNKGVAVQIQTRPAFGSNGARLPASLLQTVEHVPGVKLAVGNLIGYAQIVEAIALAAEPRELAPEPRHDPYRSTSSRAWRSNSSRWKRSN